MDEDFNARTEREGGRIGENLEEGEGKRKSRDEKVNGEGRKLCRFLEDRVVSIKLKCRRRWRRGMDVYIYRKEWGVGYRLCVGE